MHHSFRLAFSDPQAFDISKVVGQDPAKAKLSVSQSEKRLTLYHPDIWCVNGLRPENAANAKTHDSIPFLTLELDDAGRLVSIERAHAVVTGASIFDAANGMDKTSPEFHVLETYAIHLHKQTTEYLNAAQKQTRIEYAQPGSRENPAIGGVMQGFAARAQGPSGKIGYLGTFGLGPCIGIAVVTKVEGEVYPRVSVAHASSMTLFDRSVSPLLKGNGFGEGVTNVYLTTGRRQDANILKIVEALENYGIRPKFDLRSGENNELIIDLRTGSPIDPKAMTESSWLLSRKLWNEERQRLLSGNVMKSPLRLEYNLRHGVPKDHELRILRPARPSSNGHQISGPEAIPLG